MSNDLERLWSNVLSERSTLIRAQKALVDAQKKYSHAVDLYKAETASLVERATAANSENARSYEFGETGI